MGAPHEFNPVNIPVDAILIIGDRRAVDDKHLADLVESIERIGLQTPITVRIREKVADPKTGAVLDSAYVLVTGRHRFEAYRKLGRQDIPAYVRDWDEHEAELWEIAENLCRLELTADQKKEQTLRLIAAMKKIEETRKNSDFPTEARPATGRGHKGMVQKAADRLGVDHGTIRNRVKNVAAVIDEPVDPDRDSPEELTRKADQFKAKAADHSAERKTARKKDREKTQAPKPAHQNRARTHATKQGRQDDLIEAISDLNVGWPRAAIEMAAAGLTDPQKAELRQHLPDVIEKLHWLADRIGPKSANAAPDEATCADQPSLFGGN